MCKNVFCVWRLLRFWNAPKNHSYPFTIREEPLLTFLLSTLFLAFPINSSSSFAEYPLSLQSFCRLAIRRSLGSYRLDKTSDLVELTPYLKNFVDFREFISSTAQLPPIYDVPSLAKVSTVLKEIHRLKLNWRQLIFLSDTYKIVEVACDWNLMAWIWTRCTWWILINNYISYSILKVEV